MPDGRDYSRVFIEACRNLEKDNRPRSVEVELRLLEWNLYEALRGSFFSYSIGIFFVILSNIYWILDAKNNSIFLNVLIALSIFVFSALNYFVLKFVFWYEVGRHVAPRQFGEFTRYDDPTLPEHAEQV
jgi:hypothetical protein